MLRILIVEDEPLFAQTLRHLVELNPRDEVTAVAEDSASALAAAEFRRPDLALIDLQLANGTTGFPVAVKLHELGVLCLFTTGKAPSFPMPDLAVGCLVKPFSQEDLVRALIMAEDMLRGRQGLQLRHNRPVNLRLYAEEQARVRIETTELLPTPEQSRARRRLRDRAGRVLRRLSFG